MIRHAAVVAIVLGLAPSSLYAQSAQTTAFTVNVQSAAIRKSPSTGSPVIGQAPRGAVLEVTRDIGAWVKVTWPDAQDGVGYVHQSMGLLTRHTTTQEKLAAAFPPAPPTTEVAPTTNGAASTTEPGAVPMSARTTYVAPPTHFVGLGGRMTGTPLGGFGFTSRIWSRNRYGVQVDVSHATLTSTTTPERMTTLQFAPSFVYSLPDRVTEYVWVRPYLGVGGALNRSTLKSGTPEVTPSVSDNRFGYRAFGGTELTFPAVPRFAVSADLGYLWSESPFDGFEVGGLGLSVSGHWYVK
jgi:hypothetical protein